MNMQSPATPKLFTPFTIRGTTLPNRVVIAPMVQYRAADGMFSDWHLVHLGKFAMGRAGVVFTEATAVEPRGRVTHGDLGLWNDSQAHAFKRLVAFLHDQGSLAAVQLAHAGRKGSMQRAMDGGGPLKDADIARGRQPWELLGPTSEPVGPGWIVPHEMTHADIAALIKDFAEAAARADAAGFDIVEIHGAHGYLLATFLSPITNKRTDGYGGDRMGRMRLSLEVARAVRESWPAQKPLFFRVSAVDGAEGGWDIGDTVILARALAELGVDVVDCSSGGLTSSPVSSTVPRYPGFQVPFASAVKREAQVASMAVGLILDGPQAEAILQAGDADLIAIGREALYDPFWALHAAAALGCDPGFSLWPEEYGWWLEKRARALGRV